LIPLIESEIKPSILGRHEVFSGAQFALWVPMLVLKNQIPAATFFGTASLLAVIGVRGLWVETVERIPMVSVKRERQALKKVSDLLRGLDETLAAGIVPSGASWEALSALPAPWGRLASDSVQELRSAGGALRPTLKRLRELADSQNRLIAEARARASTALGQAAACAVLGPSLGVVLYLIAPGVDQRPALWITGCSVSFLLSVVGGLWMLSLAERARWAGLPSMRRHWILAVQCAGERFLSILRSGNPADLAWARACALLASEAPELAAEWGHSLWKPGTGPVKTGSAEATMAEAGDALRKAVHASLMEGRPCADRVEAGLDALRHDIRVRIDAELAQLPNRTLKPLFACAAPAVLGLVAFALYLCWLQAAVEL
jgi:hypothetical protein